MVDLNEHDDAEASYRRGYQQGANAALEAAGRLTTEKLRNWVGVTLAKWRYQELPQDRKRK